MARLAADLQWGQVCQTPGGEPLVVGHRNISAAPNVAETRTSAGYILPDVVSYSLRVY